MKDKDESTAIVADEQQKGNGFDGKIIRLKSIFREKLSKAMPRDAIKQHPTKTYLSTIKAIFIAERLNDVFGICGWNFEHEIVEKCKNGEKDYIVIKGRLYLREFDLYTPYQYGGHDIEGKGTEPADGYKSAVTDAMGKCASLLEIGIQVFKGMPESQTGNTSKRLDQKDKDAGDRIEEPTSSSDTDKPQVPVQPPAEKPVKIEKKEYEDQSIPDKITLDELKQRVLEFGKYDEFEAEALKIDKKLDKKELRAEWHDAHKSKAEIQEEKDSGEEEPKNKHGQEIALVEAHKEMFGKVPAWNASNNKIRTIVAEEKEGRGNIQEEKNEDDGSDKPPYVKRKVKKKPDPAPMREDSVAEVEAEEKPAPEDADKLEEKQTNNDSVFDTEEKEGESDPVKAAMDAIDGYVDKDALKEEAGEIIFGAQMSNVDEKDIEELKKYVNSRYTELSKVEEKEG